MKLVWLPAARDDLQRLFDFLVAKDRAAVERMVDQVEAGAATLLQHPRAGKRMPDETERREWYIPFGVGAYVLRYRLLEDRILIIRVWHSRESRMG